MLRKEVYPRRNIGCSAIITDPHDKDATVVVAFLIPISEKPPWMDGQAAFEASFLETHPYDIRDRTPTAT